MEEEIKSEMKKSVLIDLVDIKDSTFKVGHYFSSYNKLVRFLAWMPRFIKNRKENRTGRERLKRILMKHMKRLRPCIYPKNREKSYV